MSEEWQIVAAYIGGIPCASVLVGFALRRGWYDQEAAPPYPLTIVFWPVALGFATLICVCEIFVWLGKKLAGGDD